MKDFKRFPFLFEVNGKKILFIGCGAVAERKILSLMNASPEITVLSPEVTDKIQNMAENGQLKWVRKVFVPDSLRYDYVFIATDKREINNMAAEHYKSMGTPVNIADSPDGCDFHMPAVIFGSDFVVSVSTDGENPARAAEIRKKIQSWIDSGGLD